jgi:hypothetical protein
MFITRGRAAPAERLPAVRPRLALGLAVFAFVFVAFNANGREIPSADSQGAKFASVMLVRRHTLTLDGVVGRAPLLGERLAFQRDREGRWRNAYSLPPVLEAAAVASVLRGVRVLDLDAPRAHATVAKLTASVLASVAALLAFLVASRFASAPVAALVAVGFALGTGVWPVASQTLWQHASVIWSVMAALWLWTRDDSQRGVVAHAAMGLLLGWAASARPQTIPMIAVLGVGMLLRATPRQRAAWLVACAIPLTVFVGLNIEWFGHPFGKMREFETASLDIHRVTVTWQWPGPGLAGLLVSPSRGLLVFSPIVLIVCAARASVAERSILRWTLAAAGVQLLVYSSFSVWWGGFGFGPRYLLDLLPTLVPAAAIGAARVAAGRPIWRLTAAAALAWSVAVAATGAFCYPHDRWNTDPASVDRFHERLWELRDSQIPRCWARGLSPQNFALFERNAWRRNP